MAGFQQNFIYKNRCQAGFGPEVEFDDLWYGCFPHHTVLWCHILEERKGKIDFGLNSFSRAMSQRPSHTWVCVSHSALGVTETWIRLNTAFSYPSSKGAGQRGQNYGLGINLLIFFTERSLSLLVCVCARVHMCLYAHVCLCYVNMCVGTGGGPRKVLGHLDLELQATVGHLIQDLGTWMWLSAWAP